MRLDVFLKKVGIVKRRPEAARLLKAGLVLIDGHAAKAAAPVRAGTRLSLHKPPWIREYRVLEVPEGPVKKVDYGRYAKLLSEERLPDE